MQRGVIAIVDDDPDLRDAFSDVLRAVPVVVVTASGDLARQPISAAEILHKPLDIETLLASVARNHP